MFAYASRQSTAKMTNRPHFTHIQGGGGFSEEEVWVRVHKGPGGCLRGVGKGGGKYVVRGPKSPPSF